MDDLAKCVIGAWIHSHEEDTPEARIYRHSGYPFPPARGRRGFELSAGGAATLIGIAPGDGSRQVTARWTLDGQQIRIDLDPGAGPMTPVTYAIVSCEPDRLRVKP